MDINIHMTTLATSRNSSICLTNCTTRVYGMRSILHLRKSSINRCYACGASVLRIKGGVPFPTHLSEARCYKTDCGANVTCKS